MSGNLLVRALILTADSFLGDMDLVEFARGSPILRAFSRMADQVELAIKLVASVDPCCVTMENVSCINTLLVRDLAGGGSKDSRNFLQRNMLHYVYARS